MSDFVRRIWVALRQLLSGTADAMIEAPVPLPLPAPDPTPVPPPLPEPTPVPITPEKAGPSPASSSPVLASQPGTGGGDLSPVVIRALSAVGQGIAYVLGSGGRDGKAPLPSTMATDKHGNRVEACDCSGFAAWACGLGRKQPSPIGYLSTDGFLDNAKEGRLFEVVRSPRPGDLVVYGDRFRNGEKVSEGHVGVVSVVPDDWPGAGWRSLKIIHCSSNN